VIDLSNESLRIPLVTATTAFIVAAIRWGRDQIPRVGFWLGRTVRRLRA
jgi:hypothetical protein